MTPPGGSFESASSASCKARGLSVTASGSSCRSRASASGSARDDTGAAATLALIGARASELRLTAFGVSEGLEQGQIRSLIEMLPRPSARVAAREPLGQDLPEGHVVVAIGERHALQEELAHDRGARRRIAELVGRPRV